MNAIPGASFSGMPATVLWRRGGSIANKRVDSNAIIFDFEMPSFSKTFLTKRNMKINDIKKKMTGCMIAAYYITTEGSKTLNSL